MLLLWRATLCAHAANLGAHGYSRVPERFASRGERFSASFRNLRWGGNLWGRSRGVHPRMSLGYIPEVGAKVRTIASVYADPEGTGFFSFSSGVFEKVPAGSVGIVEEYDIGVMGTQVLIVRFPGNLRSRLGPTAWEMVDPCV
jgi:hypothetical protein